MVDDLENNNIEGVREHLIKSYKDFIHCMTSCFHGGLWVSQQTLHDLLYGLSTSKSIPDFHHFQILKALLLKMEIRQKEIVLEREDEAEE